MRHEKARPHVVGSTSRRLASVLSATPPLLFAAFVGKLWISGTLGYYVNGRTIWIVLLGAALFFIVGAFGMWRAVQGDGDQRLSVRTMLFLVPLIVGLAIPPQPLSAISGQASSLGSLSLASHVGSTGAGDQFGYWMNALAVHSDPSWWSGQRVTLVGFVSPQSGLPARSFIVGRYLVTCCVVDATLLGFPVQLARGQMPTGGTWVQVSGSFGHEYWTDPSGAHYPIVEKARVAPVTIPSSPYLSP